MSEEENAPNPEHHIMIAEKNGYGKKIKKKGCPFLVKHKDHVFCVFIVVFMLVMIVGIINIGMMTRLTSSCDVNDKERQRHTVPSLQDDITENKNQTCAPCEDDWIWYRGKCYYFSTIRDTWNNSQRFCESHDASLALIDNKEELEFLLRHKDKEKHWIGLKRTEDNMAWTWTNVTLYNESLFKISRSIDENIDYVYLSHESVSSGKGNIGFKWICNRK